MSEKDLEQLKKEAAEKAKAAALRKMQEKQAAGGNDGQDAPKAEDPAEAKRKAAEEAKKRAAELAKQKAAETKADAEMTAASNEDQDLAKAKAVAAAKAKAAAAAKAKAQAGGSDVSADGDDAKAKAIAAAKAKAAAAAKAKAAATGKADGGDDAKAKAIAAAKAKAAALAKAKSAGADASAGAEDKSEEPSPNQQYLDKYIKVIKDHLGEDVLEDAYINKLSKDVPTLVAKPDTYFKIAEFLKFNEQLGFDYLSEHHGTDFVTHMEVYNHFYSYKNRQSVALKVKLDRDNPVIESLTSLWPGADWPEREAYDLLGIHYTNHPNLKRIMLADDWVGHPLRKDYEQYDVEV